MVAGAMADDKKPDNAKLLIGKWELVKVKNEKLPTGFSATVDFDKNGKVKYAVSIDGKDTIKDAAYKVEQENIILSSDKQDRKDGRLTIKKLTEKELIVEDEEKKTLEYQRKK